MAAAAERGDTKAQFAMVLSCRNVEDVAHIKWMGNLLDQDDLDMKLFLGLIYSIIYFRDENVKPRREKTKDMVIKTLLVPAKRGSATAPHVLGMFIYHAQCDSVTKAGLLNAARWIHKAAVQGFMDAQYELGEMFRRGDFCDHIYMRLARKYIRRASVQGHVEAIARMKELRSCVMCCMDDAPLACARCRQARYCSSACSKRHWCEGGGVGGGVSGGAGARHKDTCPRTHSRGR
jgi:TPR repeat protein